MDKNNIIMLVKSGLFALFLSILAFPSYAQVNNEQLSTTVIDTVDDEDDLFDENTNYKELYKDLNKDGDWVTIKESDLDDDSGDPESVKTEVTNVRIINVWKPRNMGPDWSPYSEGRWVYTYSGWVWATDYDWGWAAYHYGRWVYDILWGWVWMPGRYWAPCWVQWSYTPTYIGWYPIYPRCRNWHHHGRYGHHDRYYHNGRHHHWVFVNRNRFTEKINKDVVVDKSKYADILSISKNKAIIKSDGSGIINVGPKVQTIEKNTGVKIDPKEINYNSVKGITKVDNNSISVYRNDIKSDDTKKSTVKKKENNGSTTSTNNNSTRKKDNNTKEKNSTSTNENNTSTKKENNNGTKKENNTYKTKESKSGTEKKENNSGTKPKDNTGSTKKENNTYKNQESNTSKGNSPNRESSKNRESNTYKDSNKGNSNHSSKGSNNHGSKGNSNSSSKGSNNNGSKGSSNNKSK